MMKVATPVGGERIPFSINDDVTTGCAFEKNTFHPTHSPFHPAALLSQPQSQPGCSPLAAPHSQARTEPPATPAGGVATQLQCIWLWRIWIKDPPPLSGSSWAGSKRPPSSSPRGPSSAVLETPLEEFAFLARYRPQSKEGRGHVEPLPA